jgi:hypothetical protein
VQDQSRLTTEDDNFHPSADSDPWWTETVWFGWIVPERKMLGYYYPAFRPNLGIQFGGVLIVDDTAEQPWELPFFEWDWHHQIPAGLDLRDAKLNNGMWFRAVEPTRVFEFGYSHRDMELQMRFEALMQPLVSRGTRPFNNGHIDQPGRVTGRLRLHGEEFEVDCFTMRDRSWGQRTDGRQPKVGYAYGIASAEKAFLSVSVDRSGQDGVTTGFLMRDGVWSRLASGTRSVRRDEQGRPAFITIDAADELDRPIYAEGTVMSRQVFLCYPSMFCWNSLVRWEFDDVTSWGEDQDVMHPRRWRDFVAGRRPL